MSPDIPPEVKQAAEVAFPELALAEAAKNKLNNSSEPKQPSQPKAPADTMKMIVALIFCFIGVIAYLFFPGIGRYLGLILVPIGLGLLIWNNHNSEFNKEEVVDILGGQDITFIFIAALATLVGVSVNPAFQSNVGLTEALKLFPTHRWSMMLISVGIFFTIYFIREAWEEKKYNTLTILWFVISIILVGLWKGFFSWSLLGIFSIFVGILFGLNLFKFGVELGIKRVIFYGVFILLFVIIVFGALGFLGYVSNDSLSSLESGGGWLGRFVGGVRMTLGKCYQAISGLPLKIQEQWKKQLAMATGDYFTGQTDQKANIPIGVKLLEVKSTADKYEENEEINLFTNLEAETLGDPINITLGCKITNYNQLGTKTIEGEIIGNKKINVAKREYMEIDCKIPKNKGVPVGYSSGEINANFDFTTFAYQKAYFMDLFSLRNHKATSTEHPLVKFGITDLNPQTIHTNGPVMIGMQLSQDWPMGINTDEDKWNKALGITIDNRWEGKVKKIKKLVLMIPYGFKITGISGEEVFKEIECKDLSNNQQTGCDDKLFKIYEINPKSKEISKTALTYRAYLEINKDDYTTILGTAPLSWKFFKAVVDYEYELSKQKDIYVKPKPIPEEKPTQQDIKLTTENKNLKFTTNKEQKCEVLYWIIENPNINDKKQEDKKIKNHRIELNVGNGNYGVHITCDGKLLTKQTVEFKNI